MPNTRASTPSTMPATTTNGIQAISMPMMPQVSAAVATPLPAPDVGGTIPWAGAEWVDQPLPAVGHVRGPGHAVEVAVFVAPERVGKPAGRCDTRRSRGRRGAHRWAEYRRRRGDRVDSSWPTGVGSRRAQRRQPAVDRTRSPAGRRDGRPRSLPNRSTRSWFRRSSGPARPLRRCTAQDRACRADRSVARGDPRPWLARHARREGRTGLPRDA